MSKRKSRILAIMMLTVIVLCSSFMSMNVYAYSNHINHKIESNVYEDFDWNDYEHAYYRVVTTYCVTCDEIIDISETADTEPHSLIRTDDHIAKMHYTTVECSGCPYGYNFSYPCPGNPCLIVDALKHKQVD